MAGRGHNIRRRPLGDIGIVVLLLGSWIGVGRVHGLLLTVLGAMTTLAVMGAVSYGAAWGDPAQKYLYALVGVAFGAAAFTALCDDDGRRILAGAGPTATVWTVTGMVLAVRAADINRSPGSAPHSLRASPARSRRWSRSNFGSRPGTAQ